MTEKEKMKAGLPYDSAEPEMKKITFIWEKVNSEIQETYGGLPASAGNFNTDARQVWQ